MFIYNHKIINITLLIIILYSGYYFLNTKHNRTKNVVEGSPMINTNTDSILNIKNIKQNEKIQNLILDDKKSITLTNNYSNINEYLVNIFCSETSKKYIKVASGSGIFLSNPDDEIGIILTNAHVARHLLDTNKKCVGRTKSPTTTTHTLVLRYIPSFWLDKNNQYIIGDPDQNSTGEFDFAIIESKKIKNISKTQTNIYDTLKPKLKLKTANYDNLSILDKIYIYSYPARKILSKNVNNPLFQKRDSVKISNIYSSPSNNVSDSLLDVTGSENIDHGSSGGMVVIQGQNNMLIGLSSVLIKENSPQTVRVVTLKHVLTTIRNDLLSINNAQVDPFLILIEDMLDKREFDISFAQIFKNIKLTSVLELHTKNTLINLHIINN